MVLAGSNSLLKGACALGDAFVGNRLCLVDQDIRSIHFSGSACFRIAVHPLARLCEMETIW